MNKFMLASLLEAGALILLIVFFAFAGMSTYGYEQAAEQYFLAVESGDWERAYDWLDVTESEFITKEHFVTANEAKPAGEITNYRIVDQYDSGASANVVIQYSEKESSEVQMMNVALNQLPEKKFFFFREWKVDSSPYLLEDYMVEVPAGASLYLDETEVPSGMLAAQDGDYGTVYRIPELFAGTHTLAIRLNDFMGGQEQVTVTENGESDYIGTVALSGTQQEELIRLAYEDMKKLLDAGVMGEDFSAVRDIYSPDTAGDAEKEYETYYRDHFVASGQEEGIVGVAITQAAGDFYYNYIDDGKIYAEVEVSYDYRVLYRDYDWWYEGLEEGIYDSYSAISFTFVYLDGKWKLKTCSIPYFPYY